MNTKNLMTIFEYCGEKNGCRGWMIPLQPGYIEVDLVVLILDMDSVVVYILIDMDFSGGS